MVMDITDRFILISDMLSRLTLYRIEGSGTVLVSEIDVKERETGRHCRVKNAVIGDETGSFFYCQLEQMTIAKVRSADGVIEWKLHCSE